MITILSDKLLRCFGPAYWNILPTGISCPGGQTYQRALWLAARVLDTIAAVNGMGTIHPGTNALHYHTGTCNETSTNCRQLEDEPESLRVNGIGSGDRARQLP